jgi:hypothetical protein
MLFLWMNRCLSPEDGGGGVLPDLPSIDAEIQTGETGQEGQVHGVTDEGTPSPPAAPSLPPDVIARLQQAEANAARLAQIDQDQHYQAYQRQVAMQREQQRVAEEGKLREDRENESEFMRLLQVAAQTGQGQGAAWQFMQRKIFEKQQAEIAQQAQATVAQTLAPYIERQQILSNPSLVPIMGDPALADVAIDLTRRGYAPQDVVNLFQLIQSYPTKHRDSQVKAARTRAFMESGEGGEEPPELIDGTFAKTVGDTWDKWGLPRKKRS